ncbi:MAG TPA: glycosyl hydrolase 108 family protein [Rhodospirillales bacterium]|jgi:lysozyme family protein|nr:glycosyl hydrolase 108 family protein [Rhodospirillales bacterium]
MGATKSAPVPGGGNTTGGGPAGGAPLPSLPAKTTPPPSLGDAMLGDLSSGALKLSAPVGPGAANIPDDVLRVESVLKRADILARPAGKIFGDHTAAAIKTAQKRLNDDARVDLGKSPLKLDGLVNPDGPTHAATRKLAGGVLAEPSPVTPKPQPPKPGTAAVAPSLAAPGGVLEQRQRQTLAQTVKRVAKGVPKPAPDLSGDDFSALQRLAGGLKTTTHPGPAARDIADAFRATPEAAANEFRIVRDELAKGGTAAQVNNLTAGVRAELSPEERGRFDQLVGNGGRGEKPPAARTMELRPEDYLDKNGDPLDPARHGQPAFDKPGHVWDNGRWRRETPAEAAIRKDTPLGKNNAGDDRKSGSGGDSGSGAREPEAKYGGAQGGPPPWPKDDGNNPVFNRYRERLKPFEGKFADRKVDPGGPTQKGISQRFLDKLNKLHPEWKLPEKSKKLNDKQVSGIYRSEFFDKPKIQKVQDIPGINKQAQELPEQLFDAGVQHGPKQAGQWLQQSLDERLGTDLRVPDKNGNLVYDGNVGPKTRAAIGQAIKEGKIQAINDAMVDRRVVFMRKLPKFKSNPGWLPRANSFRIQKRNRTRE